MINDPPNIISIPKDSIIIMNQLFLVLYYDEIADDIESSFEFYALSKAA